MFKIIREYDLMVQDEAIYIQSPKLKKAISAIKLSPSFINDFAKSPADAILKKYIEPEVRLEEPYYFRRGHIYHHLMEFYFKGEERGKEALKKAFSSILFEFPEYRDFLKVPGEQEWLKAQINGFLVMDRDLGFSQKNVAEVYIAGKTRPGVELIILGKLPSLNFPFVSFADVVFEENDGLYIIDWKTSPKEEFSEDNIRQQMLMVLFMEQLDFSVSGAALASPTGYANKNGFIEDLQYKFKEIPVKDEKLRKETRKTLDNVNEELQNCISHDFCFPFKKSKNNSWGSFLIGNGKASLPKINQDKLFEKILIKN